MPLFIIEKSASGTSLSEYLQEKISVAPQAYIRQLIKSGKIQINGSPARPDQQLVQGDTITIPDSRRVLEFLDQQKRQPLVLYESTSTLVVNKPTGLATHAGKGHEADNLTVRVREMLAGRKEQFMSAPVHRLDLSTSGPVIFGKGRKAISELGKRLQQQMVDKRYLALTRAGLPDKGLLSGDVPSKGKSKFSEAHFRCLESRQNLTLVEVKLLTGRQHQIRRQLADAGFPIAGDERFRGVRIAGLNRLFLHCHRLSFTEPFTNSQVSISVPLPDELVHCLKGLNFSFPVIRNNMS